MKLEHITIKAYSPYPAWLDGQRETTLQVKGTVTVRQLLALLGQLYPRFAALSGRSDTSLHSQVILFHDGRLLALDDVVPVGAKVELLPPMSGG